MSAEEAWEFTATERARMNCDCSEPYTWPDSHRDTCFVPVAESVAFDRARAAYRRALEDAADAVKDMRQNGLPPGTTSGPYAQHFESWLRARAAAADPTERSRG